MTLIERHKLEPLIKILRNKRLPLIEIARECTAELGKRGIKDEVTLANVAYYCNQREVPVPASKAYYVDDSIQSAITEARDGARSIINRCNKLLDKQEATLNPLDLGHVRAFTEIVNSLQRSIDQLTAVLTTLKPPVQIFNQRIVQIAEVIRDDTRIAPEDKRRILEVIATKVIPMEGEGNERSSIANR